MTRQVFAIEGVTLVLRSTHPHIARYCADWFPAGPVPDRGPRVEVRLCDRAGCPQCAEPECEYARLACGRPLRVEWPGLGSMLVDTGRGRAAGWVDLTAAGKLGWPLGDFLNPALELLRPHGVYLCHAALVSAGDAGVLLAGASGAGKSSLAQRLVAAGFDFVADDRCFLARRGGRFHASGVSRLAHVAVAGAEPGGKRAIDMVRTYPTRCRSGCRLELLLFLSRGGGRYTRVAPLAARPALERLLPLTLDCLRPETARAQFEFSADLVLAVPGAAVYLGTDPTRWEAAVDRALARAGVRWRS